jgi:CO/xanthine dehydrogenase Mo-binding subunit
MGCGDQRRTYRATGAGMTWIGKSLRRFEDRRLLTGQGQYVDDVRISDVEVAHTAAWSTKRRSDGRGNS